MSGSAWKKLKILNFVVHLCQRRKLPLPYSYGFMLLNLSAGGKPAELMMAVCDLCLYGARTAEQDVCEGAECQTCLRGRDFNSSQISVSFKSDAERETTTRTYFHTSMIRNWKKKKKLKQCKETLEWKSWKYDKNKREKWIKKTKINEIQQTRQSTDYIIW